MYRAPCYLSKLARPQSSIHRWCHASTFFILRGILDYNPIADSFRRLWLLIPWQLHLKTVIFLRFSSSIKPAGKLAQTCASSGY